MKTRQTILILFFLILLAVKPVFAQSDQAEPVSLEDALVLASETEKKILIDVYAAWCPYCQRMHSDVYTDESVLEAISDYFIWVKINVESDNMVNYHGNEMTEAEFASALENESIPTTYFLNKDGAIIGVQPGFIEESTFSQLLNFIGSDAFQNQSFQDFTSQRE